MPISLWIKIPYTLFVAVLVPIYWVDNGPANFLWFSDIGLLVTLVALWLESRFLLSMMADGVLLFDIVWNLVFFSNLILGGDTGSLVGYMFDPHISIVLRALSLFHVGLPIIQLWALSRLGYDIRAWKYQAAFGCILLPLTYLASDPKENINWVFGVGKAGRRWLSPPLYLASLVVIYAAVVCLPTHLVLKKIFVRRG